MPVLNPVAVTPVQPPATQQVLKKTLKSKSLLELHRFLKL